MSFPLNKYKDQVIDSMLENSQQEQALKPIAQPQQAVSPAPMQDVGLTPFGVPEAQKQTVAPVSPISNQRIEPMTVVSPREPMDFTQGITQAAQPVRPVQQMPQPTVAKTAQVQPVQQMPGEYTQQDVMPQNELTLDEAAYIVERGMNTVGQWVNQVPQFIGNFGASITGSRTGSAMLRKTEEELAQRGVPQEELADYRRKAARWEREANKSDRFWSDVISFEIVKDRQEEIEKKYEGKIDQQARLIAEVSSGALDMLPQTAIAMYVGGPQALAYLFASSASRATKEGLAMGASLSDAQAYGVLSGSIEIGTEMLSGGWAGVPKGKFTGLAREGVLGTVEEWTQQAVLKIAKTDIAKQAISTAYQYLGEGAEEYLAEVLGNWAKGVIDPNMVKSWDDVQKDAAYAGLVGALTAVVMDVGRVGAVKLSERSAIQQMEQIKSMTIDEQVVYAQKLLSKTNTELVFADEYEGQEVKGAGMQVTNENGDNVVVLPTRFLNDPEVNIITTSLVHEFTHTLEQRGQYKQFKQQVLGYLKNYGMLDALREAKASNYAKQGVQLSAQEVDNEIVATFVQDHLFKRVVQKDGKFETFTDILAFRKFLKDMPRGQFNLFKNIARQYLDSHYDGTLKTAIDDLKKEYDAAVQDNDLAKAEVLADELSDLLQKADLVDPSFTKALTLAFDELVKDVDVKNDQDIAEQPFDEETVKQAVNIESVDTKNAKYQLVTADGTKITPNKELLDAAIENAKEIGLNEKELVAIHNIRSDKMLNALRLGGFTMPSIAVTKAALGHSDFGEISVIFKPEVLNGSPTFWRDAYTARFPDVTYGFTNDQNLTEFVKALRDLIETHRKPGYDDKLNEDRLQKVQYYEYSHRNSELGDMRRAMDEIVYNVGPLIYQYWSLNEEQSPIDRKTPDYDLKLRNATMDMMRWYGGSELLIREDVELFTPSGSRRPVARLTKPFTAENALQMMMADDQIGAEGSFWETPMDTGVMFNEIAPRLVKPMFSVEQIKSNKDLIGRLPDVEFQSLTETYVGALNELQFINDSLDTAQLRKYIKKHGSNPTLKNALDFFSFAENSINTEINFDENISFFHKAVAPLVIESIDDIATMQDLGYSGTAVEEVNTDGGKFGVLYYAKPDQDGISTTAYRSFSMEKLQKQYTPAVILVEYLKRLQTIVAPYFETKPQRIVGFDEVDTIIIREQQKGSEIEQQLRDRGVDVQTYTTDSERFNIVKNLNRAKFMITEKPVSTVKPTTMTKADGTEVQIDKGIYEALEAQAKWMSEEPKDLIAVHNLTVANLDKILELGGFPMPSIAVTKDSIGHDHFGEISVIFKPEVLNGSPTFWRDAWTPRFPSWSFYGFDDYQQVVRFKQALEQRALFYRDNGIITEINYDYAHRSINHLLDDAISAYQKPIGRNQLQVLELDNDLFAGDRMGMLAYMEFVEGVSLEQMQAMGAAELKDRMYAIRDKIGRGKMSLQGGRAFMAAFGAGKRLLTKQAHRSIQNAKTFSLRKASLPFNAENVVKVMMVNEIAGGERTGSRTTFPIFSSAAVQTMMSIDEVRENKGLIGKMDDQLYHDLSYNMEQQVWAISDALDLNYLNQNGQQVMRKLLARYGKKLDAKIITQFFNQNGIDLQPLSMSDNLVQQVILPNYATQKFGGALDNTRLIYWNVQDGSISFSYYIKSDTEPTKQFNGAVTLEELGNPTLADAVISAMQAIAKLPTSYFESKPQRVVYFDEIDTVLVPETYNGTTDEYNEITGKLVDLGITVERYNGTSRTRRVAFKENKTAKFMLTETAKPLSEAQSKKNAIKIINAVIKKMPDTRPMLKKVHIDPTTNKMIFTDSFFLVRLNQDIPELEHTATGENYPDVNKVVPTKFTEEVVIDFEKIKQLDAPETIPGLWDALVEANIVQDIPAGDPRPEVDKQAQKRDSILHNLGVEPTNAGKKPTLIVKLGENSVNITMFKRVSDILGEQSSIKSAGMNRPIYMASELGDGLVLPVRTYGEDEQSSAKQAIREKFLNITKSVTKLDGQETPAVQPAVEKPVETPVETKVEQPVEEKTEPKKRTPKPKPEPVVEPVATPVIQDNDVLPEMAKAIKNFPKYIEKTPDGFVLSTTRTEPENASESVRGGTYYTLTDIEKMPNEEVKNGERKTAQKIAVSKPLINFQKSGGSTFGMAGKVTVRNKSIIEELFGKDGYANIKQTFDGILASIEQKKYTNQSLEIAYRNALSQFSSLEQSQIDNIIDKTMKQKISGFGVSFVKDETTKSVWDAMSILDAIIFDKAKANGYDSILLFGMYNDRRVPQDIRNEIAATTDETKLKKLRSELKTSESSWFRPDEVIILSKKTASVEQPTVTQPVAQQKTDTTVLTGKVDADIDIPVALIEENGTNMDALAKLAFDQAREAIKGKTKQEATRILFDRQQRLEKVVDTNNPLNLDKETYRMFQWMEQRAYLILSDYVSKRGENTLLDEVQQIEQAPVAQTKPTVEPVVEQPTETKPVEQPKVETKPVAQPVAEQTPKRPETALPGELPEPQVKERTFEKSVTASIDYNDMTAEKVEELRKSGAFNYYTKADKTAMVAADRMIGDDPNDFYTTFKTLFNKNQRITKEQFVAAQVLIQRYGTGQTKLDARKAADLIGMTAALATEYGQFIQAASIIKKLGTAGRVLYWERVAQRLAKQYDITINIPQKLREAMLALTGDNVDRKAVKALDNQIADYIADKLPSSWMEKMRAWQFMAMLSSPTTDIRNVFSNAVMAVGAEFKDAIGAGLETFTAVDKKERTKSLTVSKETRKFVKQLYAENKDIALSGGFYDMGRGVEYRKKIFNNKAMEWFREKRFSALEIEDQWFKTIAFQRSVGQLIEARGWKPSTMTSEQLDEAILYGAQVAQKRTFQQASKFANWLTNIEKQNKLAGMAVQSLVPFKKTPINIMKTGFEYSPVGLVSAVITGQRNINQGKWTTAEFLDRISAGLTGSAVAGLGFMLYAMGVILPGDDDDESDKMRALNRALGVQDYSIKIGNKYYSIDWIAPAVMPFMMGAEIARAFDKQGDTNWDEQAMEIVSKIFDPAFELTMLRGINQALSSYETDGVSKISNILSTMASNYALQFFPSIGQKLGRIADPTVYSSYTPGGVLEDTFAKIANKIPFLAQYVNKPSINIKGEVVKQSGDIWVRSINNLINPSIVTEDISSPVDDEVRRLYKKLGESTVLPPMAPSSITYQDETYQFSAAEKKDYAELLGNTAYNLLEDVIDDADYKSLSDDEKADVVSAIYDYARSVAKDAFFLSKKKGYADSSYSKLNEAVKNGIGVTEYLIMKNRFDNIKSTEDFGKKEQVIAELVYREFTDEQIERYLIYILGYAYTSSDQKYIDILRQR